MVIKIIMVNNCYEKIIKLQEYVYRIFWNKEKDYFTLEDVGDDVGDIVLVYKGAINDLIEELETLKSLMDESKEDEKSVVKPRS